MTVTMPEPVPLELPPGNPAAVDELVRDVAGAAFRLATIADDLSGPAVTVHRWRGKDADAATTQLTRVAAITRESASAVQAAAGRLSAHGEFLRSTRRQVSALRDEQEEHFRAAWQRLGQIEDPRLAVMTGSPAWTGVVEEVEAAEARRRRRHAVLLEELADDAASTVRALAGASSAVGGTGRPGEADRVLAYLAAELPGWGAPELAARGRALAGALVGDALRPEEREELAASDAALASDPAFATAFVRALGEKGVGQLLVLLGQDEDGPDDPLAPLLASALGAAVPGHSEHDGVAAVLGATYVRADDRYGAGATAVGMAAVLVAGGRSGGVRPATAGEWARQLLVREQVQGTPAGAAPLGWWRGAADPTAVAVEAVARSDEPSAAAGLLADERVWEALLARFWGDGGAALGDLVGLAGRDPGPVGDRAVRVGLETIGAGLTEGDPSRWTVDRGNVAAVSPALGDAVAAHVEVVSDALTAVTAGGGGRRIEDQLAGLAYLTLDRRAAAAVEAALVEWSAGRSWELGDSSPARPLPVVAVPSAYLAVLDHGQRLTHALDGFELQERAEARERWWNWTAGLALELISFVPAKPIGLAADVVGAVAPKLLGLDGTFEQAADRGARYDADDAVRQALATAAPEHAARAAAVAAQAEASFRRTERALGSPEPPESERNDWSDVVLEIGTDGLTGVVTDGLVDRAGRDGAHGPHGGFVPGRR